MKFLVNDFNIYYEKHGKGKESIVILPGWGETRTTFDHLIDFLKPNFTIYILDYPGFGNSDFPNRDLNIEDYAKLVLDFMNTLCIDTPIVLGHSFGGRIITLLAGKYKVKFRKIIMMDAAGIKHKKRFYQRMRQSTYKFLKKLKVFIPKKYKSKYIDKLIGLFGSSDFKNLNQNIRKTFINVVNEDLSEYLKHIKCDTLIIWGEYDEDTPLKDAYKMNKDISDSGLVVVKNTTHFPYLQNPHYVNTVIFEFLKVYAKKT